MFIQLWLPKQIFILFTTELANIYFLRVNDRNNTTHIKLPALLDKGVDVNLINNAKQTPLDGANHESEVKRLLLKL